MHKALVIKYGGHAMEDATLARAFASDIARLAQKGTPFVVVHGGGPQINGMLKRLNIESRFVDGLRVTDEKTMEVVEMVLAGQVNKDVVSRLAAVGVPAVGVCGRDGHLLTATYKKPELGRVGAVTHVDASLLACLLEKHFVPVVAPIASGPDGEAMNVNADTAAGALAGALRASYFVLISDVPGVLDGEGKLLPTLNRTAIDQLKNNGVINGGMIPKVDACLHALEAGAGQALILDGRAEASLGRYLEQGEPLGTLITL